MSIRFHALAGAIGVALLLGPVYFGSVYGAEPAAKDGTKSPKSWTPPRTSGVRVHDGRMPLFAFEGREPQVSPGAWIAPPATLPP